MVDLVMEQVMPISETLVHHKILVASPIHDEANLLKGLAHQGGCMRTIHQVRENFSNQSM